MGRRLDRIRDWWTWSSVPEFLILGAMLSLVYVLPVCIICYTVYCIARLFV